jgi:aryl-alcohol dehydrogenase-like predicted oxidoreductase
VTRHIADSDNQWESPIFGITVEGRVGRPEYVKQACDSSLQRLGIDLIDIYFQHRGDPSVPIEETVGCLSLA